MVCNEFGNISPCILKCEKLFNLNFNTIVQWLYILHAFQETIIMLRYGDTPSSVNRRLCKIIIRYIDIFSFHVCVMCICIFVYFK